MTIVRPEVQKSVYSGAGKVALSRISHCVQIASQAQAASKSGGTAGSPSTDNRLGRVILHPHLMSKSAACGAIPPASYLFIMCCLVNRNNFS
jgi:hypothetical protein